MSSDRGFIVGFLFLILVAGTVLVFTLRDVFISGVREEPQKPPYASSMDKRPASLQTTSDQVPDVLSSDPRIGPEDARVTIVVFGDFECPFCDEAHTIALEIQRMYVKDVRVIWKDFPLPTHARARTLALAARCAQDQGKFWEFANEAFKVTREQCSLGANRACEDATVVATAIGINNTRFTKCVTARQKESLVEASLNQGVKANINGVPYLFVNERPIAGLPTKGQLEVMVKAELQK